MKLKELNKKLPKSKLCNLTEGLRTDKAHHGYTRVYYEIMKEKEKEKVDMFEIGIYKGGSIRMWHNFFTNGKIYGIDNGRLLQDKSGNMSWIENERIKCYIADQRNENELQNSFKHFKCDSFDFILDDGHHFQEHQQKSLGILFPKIKSGGYYIIEDVICNKDLLTGSQWGQKREDCTDSTDYIFTQYINGEKLASDYITNEQIKYITSNIEDIFMYDKCNLNNSPINGTSKLLIIKKK